MALSELVVYGRDAFSYRAQSLGEHSKAPFTNQRQLDMYVNLRALNNFDSDEILYAAVLDQTGGPVEVFKESYHHNNINFDRVVELRPKEELAPTG